MADTSIEDIVKQIFIGPGQRTDSFDTDNTSTAFECMEGATQCRQGFHIAGAGFPQGEPVADVFLLFACLFDEDIQDFFIGLAFHQLRKTQRIIGGKFLPNRLGNKRTFEGRLPHGLWHWSRDTRHAGGFGYSTGRKRGGQYLLFGSLYRLRKQKGKLRAHFLRLRTKHPKHFAFSTLKRQRLYFVRGYHCLIRLDFQCRSFECLL